MLKLKESMRNRQSIITYFVLAVYRSGNIIYYKIHIPIIRQILWLIYRIIDKILLGVIMGCEIPAQCKIGKGFSLKHGGSGVFIHATANIGNNVTIYQQVSIGLNLSKKNKNLTAPHLGNNILICAGAKLIGNIYIGDNSTIGANAVVLSSVPENSIAVGIPAIIKSKKT